jgi:hypothetical protein
MEQVYQSCLREYMTGVDRSNRDYKTQEVFTPDWMVDLILDTTPHCEDIDTVVIDRAVGDGQFVSKVLIRKMLNYQNCGVDIHTAFVMALDGIFGIDIEKENVDLCRQRLLCGCGDPEVVALIERRILIGNTLDPYDEINGQSPQDYRLMIKHFGSKHLEMLHNMKKISKSDDSKKKQKNKKP